MSLGRMIPFTDLYESIIVQGVASKFSERAADAAIRTAIKMVADRTNAIAKWITLDHQDGLNEYAIAHFFGEGYEPLRLLRARYLGREVYIGDQPDEMDILLDPDGEWVELCRLPCTSVKRGYADEFRTSREGGDDCSDMGWQVDLHVSVTPEPTICELPKQFSRRFWSDIATGAAAFLLEMPEKSWTDQRLGRIRRDEFEKALMRLRNDAVVDYTAQTLRIERPGFGGSMRNGGARGFG